MRKGFLLSAGSLLASAGLAVAQYPYPAPQYRYPQQPILVPVQAGYGAPGYASPTPYYPGYPTAQPLPYPPPYAMPVQVPQQPVYRPAQQQYPQQQVQQQYAQPQQYPQAPYAQYPQQARPVVQQPAIQQPAIQQPAMQQPAMQQPQAQQAYGQPVYQQAPVYQPAAAQPAARVAVSAKPAVPQRLVSQNGGPAVAAPGEPPTIEGSSPSAGHVLDEGMLNPPSGSCETGVCPCPTAVAAAAPAAVGPVVAAAAARPRAYASFDYLMWWVKSTPINVPLVTTGIQGEDGILGLASTRVLIGNQDVDFGLRSGYRLTLGAWLNPASTLGVEVSGFYLESRNRTTTAGDPNGNAIISVPFNEVGIPFGETVFPISNPGLIIPGPVAGSVTVSNDLLLWGIDGNAMLNLIRTGPVSVTALAGFRYLDLSENLNINGTTNIVGAPPGFATVWTDHFGTRNQFYGGQVGVRAEASAGLFYAAITGKVALGAMQESLTIQGSGSGAIPLLPVSLSNGIFAQRSNIGTYHLTRFGVIPDVEAKVGVNIGPNLRATVGYNFLYINEVLRPGTAIDRNLNTLNMGPVPLGVAPNRPQPIFNQSDFWAQGINFGMELRF